MRVSPAEVAQRVAKNTEFDRLYFYDADWPLYISDGPDNPLQPRCDTRKVFTGRNAGANDLSNLQ